MLLQMIGGILRAVLAAYGGKLVEQGWMSSDQLNQTIGAVLVVFTALWSMLHKYRATKKFDPKTLVKQGIPIEKA